MRAWGAGVAGGYAVLGVFASTVENVPGSALFFGLCALLSMVLSQVAAPLLKPRPPGGDNPGGGDEPPEEPPPWWPEFERDFQDYVQRLTSGRR
jgi:hypothetical protein